jgi:RNA polymerase sigma factor (sigma-70 family)
MLAFETELVRRLHARDETAMTEFYRHYGTVLFNVSLRLVRHEQLAEDVVQESLVKIWYSFARYDARKGRLFTWALNVCRNTAIDHLRSRQANEAQQTRSLDKAEQWQPAAPAFQPEHVGVRELLTMLPDRDRQLLELIYFEGFTHAEAAEALDLPLGTVKTWVRRAILVLAKAAR